MPTVEFTIDGLATYYHKEERDYWNIIFPCDGNLHTVKFYFTKDEREEGPFHLVRKNITITAPNSVEPDEFEDESFSTHVLDLTGNYLHSDGLMKRRIPSVLESRMTIQNAILYSVKEREDRVVFAFPIDDPSNVRYIPVNLTETIGGRITLNDGGEVIIAVEGGPEIPPLKAGDSFRIDNHCTNNPGANDFQMYQQLFVNRVSSSKFYNVVSLYKYQYDSIGIIENKHFMTAEPPAFCDGSKISDTDGLD